MCVLLVTFGISDDLANLVTLAMVALGPRAAAADLAGAGPPVAPPRPLGPLCIITMVNLPHYNHCRLVIIILWMMTTVTTAAATWNVS